MRTRTLLLLSVATALVILVAGGVLLAQLAGRDEVVATSAVGEPVRVGDATITVTSVDDTAERFDVTVEVGGVDDDLDGITLLTGDETLAPIAAPAEGRCSELTVAVQRCRLDFDTGASEGSNRVLLVVRGEERATWSLGG